MTPALFFRLLAHEDKAAALGEVVDAVRSGQAADALLYMAVPQSFRHVPRSPFAYWVSPSVLGQFTTAPGERQGIVARLGMQTNDDFRFLRLYSEIPPGAVGCRWRPYAKGGDYAPFYFDHHLLVLWDDGGRTLRQWIRQHGDTESRYLRSQDLYGLPGLTYPRRTQKGFNVRVLPEGFIFAEKGPSIFWPEHDARDWLSLLALLNSEAYRGLVDLQMAFGSFEVGVIQRTPIPDLSGTGGGRLADLAERCVRLKRDLDRASETSHVFSLPGLLGAEGNRLGDRVAAWQNAVADTQDELSRTRMEIDDTAYGLYGISDEDREAMKHSLRGGSVLGISQTQGRNEGPDEEEPSVLSSGHQNVVADLMSYTIGCVFGRWDVRIALDPSLAAKLAGLFDPLPVCSPGTLVGPDGLPAGPGSIVSKEWLRARPNAITLPPEGSANRPTIPDSEYPLDIVWDGIAVDDQDHQDDIVRRVREVLDLLWKERAPAIEREACQILGVKSLREYFGNPKHFWEEHVKRYSKSRRKAPIYWLLQSSGRRYALWLYYHRLDRDMLYKALRNYVDPKYRLEESRLRELRDRLLTTPEGREHKALEKEIDEQEQLVNEVLDFKERLENVAALGLAPDLNDGVILNIAPLHDLVPWKEPKKYWDELLAGKYEWSTIGKQLREKGLVRG